MPRMNVYTHEDQVIRESDERAYLAHDGERFPVSESIFDFDGTPKGVANLRRQVFRFGQREYGRCTSKVYIDDRKGESHQIGWVFEKRQRYEDSDGTYTLETWLTLVEEINGKFVSVHFDAPGRMEGC